MNITIFFLFPLLVHSFRVNQLFIVGSFDKARVFNIPNGKYEVQAASLNQLRSRISDVLRSIAEQNMGVATSGSETRYTLLYDVILKFIIFGKRKSSVGYYKRCLGHVYLYLIFHFLVWQK